jgi:predicted nuclease with TOPRIM domain
MAAPKRSPESSLVQELLAARRELMVANERLRLEIDEARSRAGKPDPRLRLLEEENRRLRAELSSARAERDELRGTVEAAIRQLRAELAER